MVAEVEFATEKLMQHQGAAADMNEVLFELGFAREEISNWGLRMRCAMGLNLFCAPSSICFSHVCRWLDRWNKLKDNINETDYANQGTSNNAQDVVVQENGSNEYIEDSSTDEGEEERSIAGDLGWDLKFKKSSTDSEDDNVTSDDNRLEA